MPTKKYIYSQGWCSLSASSEISAVRVCVGSPLCDGSRAMRPTPLLASHPLRCAPILACAAAPQWRDDLPNALTVSRVVAVPFLVGAFYGRRTRAAHLPAAIFAACAFTDWLDGYLARRWAVHSEFGAFLDPVADKLLVCTCLAVLSGELGPIVALPTCAQQADCSSRGPLALTARRSNLAHGRAVIVCREVAVSALREWMSARGEREAVAVGPWGKVKTATQMVSLLLLLAAVPAAATSTLLRAGLLMLYVATALTCTSAYGYFEAGSRALRRAS
jgi:phosphatidylglycerophosphate synthase